MQLSLLFKFKFLCNAGAVPHYGAFYGESAMPILVADLMCSGAEDSLLSCNRSIIGVRHCSSYEEAGVKCLGML